MADVRCGRRKSRTGDCLGKLVLLATTDSDASCVELYSVFYNASAPSSDEDPRKEFPVQPASHERPWMLDVTDNVIAWSLACVEMPVEESVAMTQF